MKDKIILILFIICVFSITVNIIFFVSEIGYRATKKELKSAVDNVDKIVSDIDSFVSSNNRDMEYEFEKSLKDIEKTYADDPIFELEPIKTQPMVEEIPQYKEEKIMLFVGHNTYSASVPEDPDELKKLLRKVVDSHNKLNSALIKERNNRVYVSQIVTNKIVEVRTNIQYVYQTIEKLEKPKTWSYGVGINGSYNGRYDGVDNWNISIHGLVFFKNTLYFGLSLGVERQMILAPSIGAMIGWKFN